MALKGSDISATYQDWVHVNKAGAGLADHAGAEAALYLDDGAGGVDQICGRTAVRHWLDPDPDAIAGTWEFSTYGNATQAALETAGWTFTNCTASATRGVLEIVSAGSNNVRAGIVVNLAGDFDYVTRFLSKTTTPAAQYDYISLLKIGINGGTSFAAGQHFSGTGVLGCQKNSVPLSDVPSSTGINQMIMYDGLVRVCRFSGTLYTVVGRDSFSWGLGTACFDGGFWTGVSLANADALDRLIFNFDATTSGQTFMVPFLRRYK